MRVLTRPLQLAGASRSFACGTQMQNAYRSVVSGTSDGAQSLRMSSCLLVYCLTRFAGHARQLASVSVHTSQCNPRTHPPEAAEKPNVDTHTHTRMGAAGLECGITALGLGCMISLVETFRPRTTEKKLTSFPCRSVF